MITVAKFGDKEQEKDQERSMPIEIVNSDEVLAEASTSSKGISQLEINYPELVLQQKWNELSNPFDKNGENRSLKASIWAQLKDKCQNKRTCYAKIAAITVPGETKEIREKVVSFILHGNEHIKKIEEVFRNGNTWINIEFDCEKGRNLAVEKAEKKEEWLRLIIDENIVQENKLAIKRKEEQTDPNKERKEEILLRQVENQKVDKRQKVRYTENNEEFVTI
jgi:hypothetical protein